jgi:hypothetical protein
MPSDMPPTLPTMRISVSQLAHLNFMTAARSNISMTGAKRLRTVEVPNTSQHLNRTRKTIGRVATSENKPLTCKLQHTVKDNRARGDVREQAPNMQTASYGHPEHEESNGAATHASAQQLPPRKVTPKVCLQKDSSRAQVLHFHSLGKGASTVQVNFKALL